MSLKVYEYKKCSTCQKAIKFLDQHKVKFERVEIVEHPPTVAELKRMLKFLEAEGGTLKSLFNTSGIQYRELRIAEKFKSGMTKAQALKLLSQNGKLVKRPFLLGAAKGAVGFSESEWKRFL